MDSITLEYGRPLPWRRVRNWISVAGPLVLFVTGVACYAGSRWVQASGLTAHGAWLTCRIVLEGLAPLLLAAGTLWGVIAAVRTRKLIALLGLLLCGAALAFVVYHVFLSVKK